jgi:methionine biosynthesis protein MetW
MLAAMPGRVQAAVGAERVRGATAYENERADVQALVPARARRILDVGCSSGMLGAALKARGGVEVVGIEVDPGYARDAGARLDRVVVADVEALGASEDLEAELGRFDCIVLADVLEHLVEPAVALRAFAGLLEPGGRAVVSLPNVRYWETFWQLGRHGRWPRRSVGLFDRTHLRWFTLADAYDLTAEAGLEVESVTRRLLRPDGRPWPRPVERLAERLPGVRTLMCLQNLLVARVRDAGAAPG